MSATAETQARQPAPPEADRKAERAQKRAERFESLTIAAILLIIIAIFAVLAPEGSFLTLDNLRNVALDASAMLILAAGMTFLLIAAGLDLSIGAMVVFSAVVSAKVMLWVAGDVTPDVAQMDHPHLALALVLGIFAALGIGLLWGMVNGLLSVKAKIPAFIATLATSGVILGLAQVWTGGLNVTGAPIQLQEFFGLGSLFDAIPWPVVVAIVVTGGLWIVLAFTRFGLRTYAIGANPDAARRAGINVNRHLLILYIMMGVLAGIVGVIDLARFNTASVSGHTEDALAAISAVVIGGTSLFGGRGRMSGTVIGALIPAVLLNGFVIMAIDPFWQNVAVGLVLLAAVYVDQLRRRKAQQV
ncbi:ABC transporter permease [Conexibacter stalactiti]|uniref:ABC transporter permease n=1 Tax=Conexibacter stalactiti TaxID=1940611 RepID=A0ABU4HU61_9ACTN|nr:ABC transporter permease [Conexibacter stalactiti]MDW5596853.1 ABC transporter permease [Conexibacter stalactiti]MEC5037495.1 ABC transporter permease [Conexibacter stalactiti]